MAPSKRKGPRPPRGPTAGTPIGTVRAYLGRINARDPDGLAKLATAKVRFVDARGEEYALTRDAWAAFFASFPDYRIRTRRIVSQGETVAVFGVASGSFRGRGARTPGAAWRFPAAWRAVVRAGKVAEWQVYGDIEPMLKSAGQGRS